MYGFPDIIVGVSEFYSYTEKLPLIQSPEIRQGRPLFVFIVIIIMNIIIITTTTIIIN